ncbi:hypothetical protein D3C71_1994330 [compost metagenome]
MLEVQVVAQRAAGWLGAHFVQVGAPGRAGAGADQAFDFERLERFAGGALGTFEMLHQLTLGGQAVAGVQRFGDDRALD